MFLIVCVGGDKATAGSAPYFSWFSLIILHGASFFIKNIVVNSKHGIFLIKDVHHYSKFLFYCDF